MDFETTLDVRDNARAALTRLRRLLELEDWFDQVEQTADGLRLRRSFPLGSKGKRRPIQGLAAVELVPLSRELIAGGIILAGIGVLIHFLIAEPKARTGPIVGLALCAPELIVLPFVPALLRQYARGRLAILLKIAQAM